MSKKYFTSIDLQQNQLINGVVHKLASAPSSPVEGQIYYNTTDNTVYLYNGTEWKDTLDNQLTVAADSTAFVSIVNGELSFHNLAITTVTVDTTETTLADFITNNYSVGNEFQEGDMIILANATDQSQRSWIHNGGVAGTSADFTRLQTDLNTSEVRNLFSAGSGITYNSTTGVISIADDAITAAMINADVAGSALEQNVTTGALDVKVDNSSIKIVSDALTVDGDVIGTALAGNGIVKNGSTLDVNVDNSTVEIVSDTVQIKDAGITQAKLDATLEGKIVNAYKELLGNGSATSFTVTHNLGSEDIFCTAWTLNGSSKWEHAECMVTIDDSNNITVGAFPAPATNGLKILVQKAILS